MVEGGKINVLFPSDEGKIGLFLLGDGLKYVDTFLKAVLWECHNGINIVKNSHSQLHAIKDPSP